MSKTRTPRASATAANRPVILAVFSDTHCGSRVGLCPLEGVRLDDGQIVLPSKGQRWLWNRYTQFIGQVAIRLRAIKGADLWVLCNGDAVEGQHHGTTQVMAPGKDAQHYIAKQTFLAWAPLKPTALILTRGTEAHVGPSGTDEEALAHSLKMEGLPVIRDPVTELWSHWQVLLDLHGRWIEALHHGKGITGLPWTKDGAVGRLAFRIWVEQARLGRRHPDVAIRSHLHHSYDSHDLHPTRLVGTASFQLKTSHAHNAVPEAVNHVGGAIITSIPGEPLVVEQCTYLTDAPTPLLETR